MRTWISLVTAAALAGCAAYNDQCQPLVEDPNERVAFVATGTELFLDRPNTRHANNALGQQAADALVWVFSGGNQEAEFAVVNGGGLRAEGLCVTRNIIGAGPLTDGVLHEIMLFANFAQVIRLSDDEVRAVFEHSVRELFGAAVDLKTVSPDGQFLQVSREVQLTVDCALPPGARVTSLHLGGEEVPSPGRPLETRSWRMATSDYLINGGDGYQMLEDAKEGPLRSVTTAQRFGGVDSNITAAYFKQSTYNSTEAEGFQVDPGRITFNNCAVPARP